MARCRLASYDVSPPGGYLFEQTEGIKRSFPTSPIIEALAQDVSAFRAGNNLPRANVRQCIEDIDHQNAERLGCHRGWTVPIDAPADAKAISLPESHPLITPCAGCGAKLMTA